MLVKQAINGPHQTKHWLVWTNRMTTYIDIVFLTTLTQDCTYLPDKTEMENVKCEKKINWQEPWINNSAQCSWDNIIKKKGTKD